MSLWELIKRGAEEGMEALKDGVSVAGKTSRILKRRVELTSLQSSVRKVFVRLGSLAYQFHSRGEGEFYASEEVKGLIAQIEGHKVRVREIVAEIETLKREEGRRASKPGEEHPPMAPL